jgi:peptide methionine sulfoxide reductase MsrA
MMRAVAIRILHQQYLAKNPDGYCPHHSCGVSFKSAELQVGEKA